MLKAVIFDYTTLLGDPNDIVLLDRIRILMQQIKQSGLSIVVFTTHDKPIATYLSDRNLPPVDLILCFNDVGFKKGNPQWVHRAAHDLGLSRNNFCYIGDDNLDWRTAINTPVFYVHADWVKKTAWGKFPDTYDSRTALLAKSPDEVWKYITHFLLPDVHWQWAFDEPLHQLVMRSLLSQNVKLPTTQPKGSSSLQDLLKNNKRILVGIDKAEEVLIRHTLSNLLLEDLIDIGSYFCVYPSSGIGKSNQVLAKFLQTVSRSYHGFFHADLLVRHTAAPDTSLLRYRMEHSKVNYSIQANSVYLNSEYQDKIIDRNIVVFDDFTTEGFSLDWVRNLFVHAGARKVTLVTLGKYSDRYSLQIPKDASIVRPFEAKSYDIENDFDLILLKNTPNNSAAEVVKNSLTSWCENSPLTL